VAGELDLRVLTVSQSAGQVVWSFRTTRPFLVSQFGPGRMPCLMIFPHGSPSEAQKICIVGRSGPHALFRIPVAPNGPRARFIAATITRPDWESATVTFSRVASNLTVGVWDLQMTSVWTNTTTCPAASPCRDLLPHSAVARWQVDQYVQAGCIPEGPSERFNGPAAGRLIALSFDDGPSAYTPQVLSVLAHFGVHATFFEIGEEVASDPAASRAVLAEGSVIGDHTWSHPILTTANVAAQVQATQREIQAATGYTPCLLRPPYGIESTAVVNDVRRMGLLSILWDVDPRDWSLPGTAAIVQNVLANAHPGAIVIMHDGGGPRSETVAALETIIPTLEARGYHFVTVRYLLGLPVVWRYFP